MNEHEHKVKIARIKYPLKKTILLNPILFGITNEFGEELIESKNENALKVEKFLIKLEMIHKKENCIKKFKNHS